MAQTQWVSFQELKEKISMSDLLAHYGLKIGCLIDYVQPTLAAPSLPGDEIYST